MSVLADHGQFETAVDQPFFIVATLWRGAMVERFARIEFFVDRSIAACARMGVQPAASCHEHLPMKRIETLLASLADDHLAKHSLCARDTLQAIKRSWQQRNALCHGRMRVLKRSVRIDWTSYAKGCGSPSALCMSDTQMLEVLVKMDRAQAALGSQLGKIDRICADLTRT